MTETLEASNPRTRKTARRHRSPHGPGLWVTDGELIDLVLCLPTDTASPTIAEMDRRPALYAFPPKHKEWGDRRYLPAVEAWFEAKYGLKINASQLRRVS